ncbi:MAG TPA: SulP family inorganic anion transporter [Cyclobacteriaceae bacterium]|nr:SulP family inorganic anion transporter [Cyclobacteriaceae bacterium]
MKTIEIPKDGLEGLKQNWRVDALSGFLVFLLALPLSLGIAKASEFPAAMGVLTAMIGGIVVGIFQGGRLTIKGPAAGLITVCSGAVIGLGGGLIGWHAACGVIVVTAIIQFLFGVLKFGSLSDFFPHSAVHGMLAAIGVLIFAKQFPILLGVDPALSKGLSPIQLYLHIPEFIANATPNIALIGIISCLVLFGLPALKVNALKKVPAPMLVLLLAVPIAMGLDFKTNFPNALVKIGNFWQDVTFNTTFDQIGSFVFWKFVFMFLFVNSLESLLTVKAIDGLDPWKRKSDYNTDLKALAVGNGLAGLFGGLPMISEVARSSANVGYGARTRWANVFHGVFLLVAMLALIPFIEMIPNAALAAMLISVSYRLANPKEFIGAYKIGAEQLVIFLVTIFVTVAEDLLLGVAAGILVKFIFHIANGAPVGSLFKAKYALAEHGDVYDVKVKDSAIFSNLLGYQKMWKGLKPGKKIVFDFTDAKLVDHTFQEALHHFEEDYHVTGGTVKITGFTAHKAFSAHPLAAKKATAGVAGVIQLELNERQVSLRSFAEANDYTFYPQKVRNPLKYKDFPIQNGGARILYEENVLSRYTDLAKVEVADMTLTEGALQAKSDTHITVAHISETDMPIPDFALEPEGLWSKFSELVGGKDIDFIDHPDFSKKYYLRGNNEAAVREFFSEDLVRFFESHDEVHVECHRHRLLVYMKRDLLELPAIEALEKFSEDLMQVINQKQKTAQAV